MTLDEALLDYMARYYVGSHAQAESYRSCLEPKNLLDFHRALVLGVFARHWFVDDGATREQLIARAGEFRDGFLDFVSSLPTDDAQEVLTELKRAMKELDDMVNVEPERIMAEFRTLRLSLGKIPPAPDNN